MPEEEKALDHETRKMIFNHIASYPGVSYVTLKHVFSMADGTLRYHLNYLVKTETIKLSMDKGKRIYYPNMHDTSSIGALMNDFNKYNLTKSQEKILNTIKNYPGITQGELIKLSGLKRFTITNSLKRLMNINLVRKIDNGTEVCYEFMTDEELRYELLKDLVIKLIKKDIDETTFLKLKSKLE